MQENILTNIQEFLRENHKNTIDIYNVDNEKLLVRKITINEILQKAESLKDFIVSLHADNVEKIAIQKYRSNGSSNTRVGIPNQIAFKKKTTDNLPKEVVNSGERVSEVVQPYASQPSPTYRQLPGMNSPMVGMNGIIGMNAAEVTDLRVKSERYDEVKEQLHTEKIRSGKLEIKVNSLEAELKKANNDLALAEERKNLELDRKDLERKPLLSEQTIKTALETFGPVISNMQQSNPAGMAAPEEKVSEAKSDLIEIVRDPSTTDELARETSYILIGIEKHRQFREYVQKGLTTFKLI